MSNQVTIQRREVRRLDTGHKWLEVHIFDDYGSLDSVPLEFLSLSDLTLFEDMLNEHKRFGYSGIEEILQYLYENKAGVTVDGTYYDYSIIGPMLCQYMGVDYE